MTRGWPVAALLGLLAAVALLAAPPLDRAAPPPARAAPPPARAAPSCGAPSWVTSWATSPQRAEGGFRDQTLRLVVTPHARGSRVRLRLTNRFATSPVTFAAVHVGRRRRGAALVRGTNRPVTFSGARSTTLAAGAEVVSDPVTLATRPFEDLAVSLRLDGPTGPAPVHAGARQTSYRTPPGSSARGGEASGAAFAERMTSWPFLTGVEVLAPPGAGTIAALGDSITEGGNSTPDADRRWTDELRRRLLAAGPPLAGLSVANAGIGGNRVTRDHPVFGPSALGRLDADVLSLAGLRAIVVFAGTNDIAGRVTAAELVDALGRLVAAGHARGVPVLGATITPASGTRFPRHGDARAAAVRREVNAWIRTGGAFDAVLDFEQALRDPSGAERLAPAYDSGDGLHPGDAGMRALAAAVPLGALRPLGCARPRLVAAVRAAAVRGGLRVRTTGRVTGAARACAGRRVAVTVTARSRTILRREARLDERCGFRSTVTVAARREARARALRVRVAATGGWPGPRPRAVTRAVRAR